MDIEIRWLCIRIFVYFFMFSDYSKSLTRISHSQALSLNFQPYLAGGPHGALAMDALHQRWKRCIETTRKTMEENTRWSENCGFIGSSWFIVIVSVGPPFCVFGRRPVATFQRSQQWLRNSPKVLPDMSCHTAQLGQGVDWDLHDGIAEFLGFEDALVFIATRTGVRKNTCQ